jgi:hypothetical protein
MRVFAHVFAAMRACVGRTPATRRRRGIDDSGGCGNWDDA